MINFFYLYSWINEYWVVHMKRKNQCIKGAHSKDYLNTLNVHYSLLARRPKLHTRNVDKRPLKMRLQLLMTENNVASTSIDYTPWCVYQGPFTRENYSYWIQLPVRTTHPVPNNSINYYKYTVFNWPAAIVTEENKIILGINTSYCHGWRISTKAYITGENSYNYVTRSSISISFKWVPPQ